MTESRAFPIKLLSWEDYVKSKASKDEKISALVRNKSLLFSDPDQLRGDFWKSLLPKAVELKFIEEYLKGLEEYRDIESILGPTTLSKVKIDVENAFGQFKKQKNAFRVDDVVKLVAIFTNSRKGMCYHSIWSFLAATFSTFADNNDTYIFLGQCVKFLFPLKVFTTDKHFIEKRLEKNIFRNIYAFRFPRIEKSLTLKQSKKTDDPRLMEIEVSNGDFIHNKEAFEAFTDHLYEELIMKCFWNQLKPTNFLKLCDLTMIYGSEFIKRTAFHYLKNYEIKFNNSIKRSAKGIKHTPSSLIFVANSVINEILHTNISTRKFKTLALDIINYRDEQKISEKSVEKIIFDANLEEAVHTSTLVSKKIDHIKLTKMLLVDFKHIIKNIELDKIYQMIDNEVIIVKKKHSSEFLTYNEFSKLFQSSFGPNVKMDIIALVDINNNGNINPLKLKVIFTYLSELPTKEKWKKIMQLYPFRDNSENFDISKAWDFIYFWSSILLRDYSEILENKHLIMNKFQKYAEERKIISDDEIIYKILEMPETSYFAYFLNKLDHFKDKRALSDAVKQIQTEEKLKKESSNIEQEYNYQLDLSDLQKTPSDILSVSSDNDDSKLEKISFSKDYDNNEIFFSDNWETAPHENVPENQDNDERQCFKSCLIF